jgi:hypothetical protein
VISHEAIQTANRTRRPAARPDESGGSLPNGASRKASLNKRLHDTGWGCFLSLLACKAAWAGKRVAVGQSGVHQPGLQRLRRERGPEHPVARAVPAGTRGGGCGGEPRTHGA